MDKAVVNIALIQSIVIHLAEIQRRFVGVKCMPELTTIEEVKILVNRADMTLAQDKDVWNENFLASLVKEGFTMKGGVYVGLEMQRNGETMSFDYVPVARRTAPMEGEPNNTAESIEPRFMKNYAFRNENTGGLNWGADFINTIIAENEGKMPDEWLEQAFATSEVEIGEV